GQSQVDYGCRDDRLRNGKRHEVGVDDCRLQDELPDGMLNAMPTNPSPHRASAAHGEAGFSLIELVVVVAIMMMVSGIVMTGVADATKSQRTMSNRVQMHAGVRSATELLQQEVGQAGRVILPGTTSPTLTATANAGTTTAVLSSAAGIFVGERLVIDPGSFNQGTLSSNEETVQVSAVN